FGDLQDGGKIFYVDADSITQNVQSSVTQMRIEFEGDLFEEVRQITDDGVDGRDSDLRFGYDWDNELYVLSKYNGRVYKVATPEPPVPVGSQLINISTRGNVKTGDDVLIGGFVINGSDEKTVLIQAVGSELEAIDSSLSGQLLNDPQVALYDSSQQLLLSNDDWESEEAELKDFLIRGVGATVLASGSTSASILTTLQAGAYTAIVSGKGDNTGVALVEVYEVGDALIAGADILEPDNPDILALWNFDDVSDSTVFDVSAKGNNGTRTGGTIVAGVSGNAMSFNGTSDSISIPASTFSTVSDEITISMWVYGINQPSSTIVFRGDDASGNRAINIHLPWSNSQVYWDCGNDGTSSYDRVNETASESQFNGQWNHWAFTKNTNTGHLKIYHNGTVFAESDDATRIVSPVATAALGSGLDGNYYQGYIDEVVVFDRELNEDEISIIYNSY
ncbi:LamG domain-containing protein, partial [Puniceicoccaceae bacterium K14]|nr:LamG domain-containing protein [Puniceicoccaceae bacterium K14]